MDGKGVEGMRKVGEITERAGKEQKGHGRDRKGHEGIERVERMGKGWKGK